MLSLFPQLLFLTPLSATMLRVAAGIVFCTMAWYHYSRRNDLGSVRFFIIGSGVWIPLFAAVVEICVATMLIAGVYAQATAVAAALLALKGIVWKGRYPQFFPLSRTAYSLLLAICFSLIITGAGVFAFDLPL